MSSILDALSKVEAAEHHPAQALPLEPMPVRRPRRHSAALLAVAAFGGGAILAAAVAWHRLRPTTAPAAPPPPAVPAAARAATLDAAPPVPAPGDSEQPWAEVVQAPAPATPVAAAAPAAPAPLAVAEPARPTTLPRVRVSFLVYSVTPERRTVALSIEDGPMTTLREGGRSGGIEVVRILPDRVDLRRDGITFTVMARDG